MISCAACGKLIRKNAYSWSVSWDRPEGYSKKAFNVRFHNEPSCIRTMTERLDGYAFEQQLAAALDVHEGGKEFFELEEI